LTLAGVVKEDLACPGSSLPKKIQPATFCRRDKVRLDQAGSLKLQATSYKLQATSYKLQATSACDILENL